MELLKPLRFISSLNRNKQDPGKFVHFIQKSILPTKEFSQIIERGDSQFLFRLLLLQASMG